MQFLYSLLWYVYLVGYLISGFVWTPLYLTGCPLVKKKQIIYGGFCLKYFLGGIVLLHPFSSFTVISVIFVWFHIWGLPFQISVPPYIVRYVLFSGSFFLYTGYPRNILINTVFGGEGVSVLPVHWMIFLQYIIACMLLLCNSYYADMQCISLIHANISSWYPPGDNLFFSVPGIECP